MTSQYPPIDLKSIAYPTDRLTFGALRRLYPDLFDHSEEQAGAFFNEDLPEFETLAVLNCAERMFVAGVYSPALRGVIPATVGSGAHPAENPDWGDGSLLLTSGWQQFRLAAGPHEAAEMLRDLVCAALAQARRQLGRGV